MTAPFTRLTAETFVLPQTDIDTDQIIPARFLTTTSRDGLGASAFYDWRFDADGAPKADDPFAARNGAAQTILVAGDNFGCGSSREHAPWALLGMGFRVVLSTGIADIFRSNALKNGLLAVEINQNTHDALSRAQAEEVTVDLEEQVVVWGGGQTSFEIDAFARTCLLNGKDQLGMLVAALPEIVAFEGAHGR